MAMPTLVATPLPSGPVVLSTPLVQRYSGWPGQRLSSCRKRLIASSGTDGCPRALVFLAHCLAHSKVQQRIQRHRGLARRENETISIGPDWVLWVEAQELLP